MEKTSPYFTASAASFAYFTIFLILKYLLNDKIDLYGALVGALIFWIVIFIVHKYLNSRCE